MDKPKAKRPLTLSTSDDCKATVRELAGAVGCTGSDFVELLIDKHGADFATELKQRLGEG